MKFILNIFLTSLILTACNSDEREAEHSEVPGSSWRVERDTCRDGAMLRMFEGDSMVYKYCFIDAYSISEVDSLPLFDSGSKAFIFGLEFEDYTSLQILSYDRDEKHYFPYDVVDVSDPETYGELRLAKGEKVQTFKILDINGDGVPELITNVVGRDGFFRGVPGFSDTLSCVDIRKKLEDTRSKSK